MSGETLIQQASRANQKKYQDEQGKLGAFAGRVVSVTPINDEVGMSFGPAAERRMPVQHPFVGTNSWIRSMPDVGTLYLMQNRFDSGQAEAVKTIPVFSRVKSDEYQKGLNVYRSLAPGEHDLASTGYAFAYLGRRGNVDLRSGASVKFQLNRENQDIIARAPTHSVRLVNHLVGEMGDEQRLGIVKRWDSAAEETYVQKNEKFVNEHYLQLKNPAGEGPAILLRHIEGQVYDDDAQEIKHQTTALPLRSQSQWFTTTDEYTLREIDQNGNMLLRFPSTATTGYEVEIPEGSYRKVIGKDRDVTIQKDEKVVVNENINYTVGQNVAYTVAKNLTMNVGANVLTMIGKDKGKESISFLNGKSYGMSATSESLVLTGPSMSMSVGSSGATALSAKQSLTLTVDQAFTMEGKELTANFSTIKLGKGAAIPAVLGMALQAYLDQHQHTTTAPGTPTSPPNVPSASFNGTPQSITSVKITLMGNI